MKSNNLNKKRPQENNFNQVDVYGVMKPELEVDTDVNEDANRERLLDESLDDFVHSTKRK